MGPSWVTLGEFIRGRRFTKDDVVLERDQSHPTTARSTTTTELRRERNVAMYVASKAALRFASDG